MAHAYRKDGAVSLWIGQKRVTPGSNFLRDQFGVDYYDPDNQECIVEEAVTPIFDLVSRLTCSESFRVAAIEAVEHLGVTSALWVMAQFDFAYDPLAAGLKSAPSEPLFIGKFDWHE